MAKLTDEARIRYEDYIRQVRAYLAAAGTVSPDDVVAELQEHVERELKDADEPVSPEAMQEVLTRLGQPSQWIGDEELPWWRKVLLRIRTGPEDWRLAYATFGVLLLGVLLGWLFGDTYISRRRKSHEFSWTVMFMFLAASFILARAVLVTARGDSLPSGRKWLIYPSLVLPYAMILLLIVASVPIAVGAGELACPTSRSDSTLPASRRARTIHFP